MFYANALPIEIITKIFEFCYEIVINAYGCYVIGKV